MFNLILMIFCLNLISALYLAQDFSFCLKVQTKKKEKICAAWCHNRFIFSLQVEDPSYDGFRRLSATFEELEERVNASDSEDEDVFEDKYISEELNRQSR